VPAGSLFLGGLFGEVDNCRAADRYRLREFGVHEPGGAPVTRRSAVRSTNTWLPSVRDGAVKCGLGVRCLKLIHLTQAHRAVPS
jgi:hypothetical protein